MPNIRPTTSSLQPVHSSTRENSELPENENSNSSSRNRQRNRRKKPDPKLTDNKSNKTSKCGSETAGEHSERNDDDLCIICAVSIKHVAIGPCNHRFCHVCCLRMRALYKHNHCPICKSDIPVVLFVDEPVRQYAEYSSLMLHDERLKISFESKEIQQDTEKLLLFSCPLKDCSFIAASGLMSLKAHVSSQHSKFFCELCLEHKKSFCFEQALYGRNELVRHTQHGTSTRKSDHGKKDDGFRGHPYCTFCKTNFFDGDAIYEHVRENHETCFICDRQNPKNNDVYQNYDTLRDHFNKEHFLCRDPTCLEKRFVVFSSKIDFMAHENDEHPDKFINLPKFKQRQARQINVNFSYSSTSNDDSLPTSSRSRRNEGRSSRNPRQENGGRQINKPEEFQLIPEAPTPRRDSIQSTASSQPSAADISMWPTLNGVPDEPNPQTPVQKKPLRLAPVKPSHEELWPELNAPPLFNAPSSSSAPAAKFNPPNGAYSRQLADKRPPLNLKRPENFGQLPPAIPSSSQAPSNGDLHIPSIYMEQISRNLDHNESLINTFKNLTNLYHNGHITASEFVSQIDSLVFQVRSKRDPVLVDKLLPSLVELMDKFKARSLQLELSEYKRKLTLFPELPQKEKKPSNPNVRNVLKIVPSGSKVTKPAPKKTIKPITTTNTSPPTPTPSSRFTTLNSSDPTSPSYPLENSLPDHVLPSLPTRPKTNYKVKGKKVEWYNL